MARTYSEEKALGKLRRRLLRWADHMEKQEEGMAEADIPTISEGQNRAFRALLELFHKVSREDKVEADKPIIINLEAVSTEDLIKRARESKEK